MIEILRFTSRCKATSTQIIQSGCVVAQLASAAMSCRTAFGFAGNTPFSRARPISSRAVSARAAKPTCEGAAPRGQGIYGAAAAFTLLCADPAFAVGGQYGILEGRSFALLHPIVMAALFGSTLYTGWLGWQVRNNFYASKR